jgi:hypothetical protein
MEQSLLTVVAVSDSRTDKNGKTYRMVTLQNPVYKTTVDPSTGEIRTILTPALKASHTAYDESYLDGTPEWLCSAKPGDLVEGRVEKRAVEQYEFTGRDGDQRLANSYTSVVFGDTTQANWEDLVKAAFERNGHKLAESVIPAKRVDITAGASKQKAVVNEEVDQF